MVAKKTLKEKELLYIVLALKAEAQAYVDKYRLHKTQLHGYTLYSDTTQIIIVSGMGVDAARSATQALIDTYDIDKDDIFLNYGICAAPKEKSIGTLHQIGSIIYHDSKYTFKNATATILCVDKAMSKEESIVVDMESFGFYDAVVHNPAIEKFYIFKVVSDHFQPHKVTKESAKKLLFNKIDAINEVLYTQGIR